MYPTVNGNSERLRRSVSAWLRPMIALLMCCGLVLQPVGSAQALSDAQQLVVESWRLVNQGYLSPERLDEIRWRRQRQKALERSISSSEDAYKAIEVCSRPLKIPIHACCARMITPL